MSILDAGLLSSLLANPAKNQLGASPSGASSQSNDADQQFINYVNESPMQRMMDAWLKAHHLTEKELDALPPAQRDAILKQMASDIKNEIKKKAEDTAAAV